MEPASARCRPDRWRHPSGPGPWLPVFRRHEPHLPGRRLRERYVSEQPLEVPVEDGGAPSYRADLEFHDLKHDRDSYEGRVFLNSPGAGLETALAPEDGYAASFYVFGHGPCYGDE